MGTFVKSVKRETLDEIDPVYLSVVDFRPELDASRFLSPDDGTNVVLGNAYDPVTYLLPGKQSCLLVEYSLDDRETLVELRGLFQFFTSLACNSFICPTCFSCNLGNPRLIIRVEDYFLFRFLLYAK